MKSSSDRIWAPVSDPIINQGTAIDIDVDEMNANYSWIAGVDYEKEEDEKSERFHRCFNNQQMQLWRHDGRVNNSTNNIVQDNSCWIAGVDYVKNKMILNEWVLKKKRAHPTRVRRGRCKWRRNVQLRWRKQYGSSWIAGVDIEKYKNTTQSQSRLRRRSTPQEDSLRKM